MIRGFSDHAANERTFLAWVRTAIAVIAFGFVIEKFNLFVLTVANANSLDAERRLQLERLSGSLGRYDGLALILFGLVQVVVAAARFVRTERLLDVLPKIGCCTRSPGAIPRRAAVPPFSSITARTGAAAAITSSDWGTARSWMLTPRPCASTNNISSGIRVLRIHIVATVGVL